jgi:hypothetical protein
MLNQIKGDFDNLRIIYNPTVWSGTSFWFGTNCWGFERYTMNALPTHTFIPIPSPTLPWKVTR